jgi:hypothetical protein
MSKVAISGNASGTGVFTIASPSGNTDRVLTLPDATGTILNSDASGNVGIGTNSPTEKLDVNGNIIASQSITIGSNGLFQAGSIYSDTNWGMLFRAKQASPGQADFAWQNSAGTERARIDSSGNLLVGTLASYSTTGITINTPDTSGCWSASDSASGRNHWRFYNPNGVVGGISTSGTATTYSTSSDYRLKENVQPITGALATVTQLKPVTYKWKSDGSDGQGFIAHELQAVVPDCVVGEKDAADAEGKPVYQGIDTSFLVATLTAAIQELKAIVDAQGAEIAALKGPQP